MLKILNDCIRFLMEIITIILLIICGFHFEHLIFKALIGILIPILIMIYWSIYMAPKSKYHLTSDIKRLASEFIIFGATTTLIYLQMRQLIAVIYFIIIFINTVLDHVFNQK